MVKPFALRCDARGAIPTLIRTDASAGDSRSGLPPPSEWAMGIFFLAPSPGHVVGRGSQVDQFDWCSVFTHSYAPRVSISDLFLSMERTVFLRLSHRVFLFMGGDFFASALRVPVSPAASSLAKPPVCSACRSVFAAVRLRSAPPDLVLPALRFFSLAEFHRIRSSRDRLEDASVSSSSRASLRSNGARLHFGPVSLRIPVPPCWSCSPFRRRHRS